MTTVVWATVIDLFLIINSGITHVLAWIWFFEMKSTSIQGPKKKQAKKKREEREKGEGEGEGDKRKDKNTTPRYHPHGVFSFKLRGLNPKCASFLQLISAYLCTWLSWRIKGSKAMACLV